MALTAQDRDTNDSALWREYPSNNAERQELSVHDLRQLGGAAIPPFVSADVLQLFASIHKEQLSDMQNMPATMTYEQASSRNASAA